MLKPWISSFKSALCTGLLVLLVSPPAMAAVVTWNGATSGDFLTGTNWSGNAAPSAADDVAINNGALLNQPTLGAGDSSTVNTVDLSAGSLDVDGNLTATSGVTVSGSGALRIGLPGSVIGDVTNSGTLSSLGFIAGNVTNSGTLSSLGSIEGNLTLTDASVLQVLAAAGMTVDGFVALGGVLELDFSGIDFSDIDLLLDPVEFDIITARGIGESFSSFEVAGLADGLSFSADIIQRRNLFIYQGVVERARQEVPEPATWLLVAIALTAMLQVRARRAGKAGGLQQVGEARKPG